MTQTEVKCELQWSCATTPAIQAAWQNAGYKYVCCSEPGLGSGTVDNYLAVKLASPDIDDWELRWTCAGIPDVLADWQRIGFQYVKCDEPGWGKGWETNDNYFGIKVTPKAGRSVSIDLDWKCATTQLDTINWGQRGFTYVRCEEPGLGGSGSSSDNYLAMRISVSQ